MIHRSHSLKACMLIVGATRITEFGESDAVKVEPMVDMVEAKASADGYITFDYDPNEAHIAEITVRQNSFAYRVLSELVEAQAAALKVTGQIPAVPFSLTNPAIGDVVSDIGAVFLNRPGVFANKGVSDVVFRICLASPKVLRGTTITPPAAA